MKKLILSMAMCMAFGLSYGQLKVVSGGDVGIGTSSPGAKLDIQGGVRVSNSSTNFSLINNETNGIRLNIAKRNPSSNAIIDMNPEPLDGVSNSKFRFFRATNTTGDVKFEVHFGDGSSGVNCEISGNTDTKLNKTYGNVLIGNGIATSKLSVNGTADKAAGGVWGTFSDKRLKKDIKPYKEGLNEILQIKPVLFKYNGKAQIQDTESEYVGIIAQEMQKVSPRTIKEVETYDIVEEGNELNGSSKKINFKKYLHYDGTAITYMLVNAVQEQQDIINDQAEIINSQTEELENLSAKLATLEDKVNGILSNELDLNSINVEINGSEIPNLTQNIPNPFSGQTLIKYEVPSSSESATIVIHNIDGAIIKTIPINQFGKGELNLKLNDLPSGTYSYQLLIDNKVIVTKKMVLSN